MSPPHLIRQDLPAVLVDADARLLASRLFGSCQPEHMPLWLDGGTHAGAVNDRYAPRSHRLAAYPDRVSIASVKELRTRELIPWLRKHLAPPTGGTGLTVVGLAYEAGLNLEPIKGKHRVNTVLPDVIVAHYPAFIEATDHKGPWKIVSTSMEAQTRLLASLEGASQPPIGSFPTTMHSSVSQEQYKRALGRVLEGIGRGDFYQANIARRLEAKMSAELTPQLYFALRAFNPASFGLLWAVGEGRWIASSSPECLLTWDPQTRKAHSYPIKGTRPRSGIPDEDQALAAELLRDPKEQAEHVMIVDLVRNDLGRVAAPGSVTVEDLFHVHTLPTVHHLISDVSAVVREDRDLADLIGAMFPGGSITGAPKIAAMEVISEIENNPRSFYTGSVGVIEADGRAIFNILIRTCLACDETLHYYTGGGIVADSVPEKEWDETETKAAAVLTTLSLEHAKAEASS